MENTRRQLHELVDAVNPAELNVVFHLLMKFIEEDAPTPDEVKAIQSGREDIDHGDYVDHTEIKWD